MFTGPEMGRAADRARRPRPVHAWQLPEQAPVPTDQAAVLDAQLDHLLVRKLGVLPLLVSSSSG
jgi:hypothetical protein